MAHKFLLAVPLCLLLAACGSPAATRQAGMRPIGGATGTVLAVDQTLRWANGSEPQSLDPHKAPSHLAH